jgi:hypothetical protein
MKTKMALTTLFLLMSPAAAFALGCQGDHAEQQAAISCADGTTFDAAANTCVVDVTG